MSDILTITLSGRLTKDPELRTHNDKSFTTFSIACTSGFGDRAKTLYFNCTASGDAISKYFKKGDQIFITGEPTQNKKDKEVYHGVRVTGFTFGQKAGQGKSGGEEPKGNDDAPPYDDSDIPF